MSVETYFDHSFYPGMGTVPRVPPTITSPADGTTVPPVHDVTGTAEPGQVVTLWSAIGDDPLAVHSTVTADEDGNWASVGEQVTGRDGDVAHFVARTLGGSSETVSVTVAGPVLETVLPSEATTEVSHAFIATGQRLDSVSLEVRLADPDGTARRITPETITATQVTFDATFATEGTAEVSLAKDDNGPEMTAALDVVVTAAEPAPEPEGDA